MRIDRLELRNFKKFGQQSLDLHPRFTLLVGENGSGKTSILDALAVAMGIWLVRPPDSEVRNSGRKILRSETRVEGSREGDRVQFREQLPTVVSATGQLVGRDAITWTRWRMRRIEKRNEPAELRHWRAAHQVEPAGSGINYGYAALRQSPAVTDRLLDALLAEQGGLCAYTGRRIGHPSAHVEHLIPQVSQSNQQVLK